jgi:hypothetical protein
VFGVTNAAPWSEPISSARHDLLGDEVREVDDRDPRVGLVVDEDELAVVVAGGLGQRRVVHVGPRDVAAGAVATGEHALGLIAVAVALPRLGREHADVLEDAHARHADHDEVAAVTARRERQYSSCRPSACRS